MLLMMLERNEDIHSVVFFDTGWEFPEMIEHIEKLRKLYRLNFVRLQSKHPFDYWMFGLHSGAYRKKRSGPPNRERMAVSYASLVY